ncbi:sensor histidine kinase [Planosporangium mesophilum]|uniref:histidine kinase n=1 Tax=Planosporangium mesophilum TaxID=689768 RepID=A0A8J3TCH8_9ACTN|nr:HAMP domain-containing sensor histidine kinase [Planosporangium mesophilum]NJC85509.1 HAMP domain-containing histidine kinase [Planosporangium mesophilum]GII24625.1 two-component sensor histidine kinase [Planosporangium mesophilum]
MATRAIVPGRLRRRLTIAFVLVAGVSAAVLAVGSYLMVRQARFDDSLRQATVDTRYQLVLARQFLPLDDERSAGLLASFETSGRHVLLATGDATTASNASFSPAPGGRLRAAVASGQLGYERTPGDLLVVGGRIPGSTAELYVVHPEGRIRRDLDQLRYALVAGWIAVVLLAAGVGHVLARRTLEPVGRASRAARAVAEGLLATRLPVTGRDEFGAWAASFNDMAQALETKINQLSAAQARERRFTADVAHELRTPVTALVAEASLLADHLDRLPPDTRRPAELLVADMVRLRRLLEELMEISRLDAGQEPVFSRPVDLAVELRSLVEAHGWRDRVTVTGEPAVVRTDPRRLDRVVANLIANAVEHGDGRVGTDVRRDGTTAVVTVTDEGPGIAPEHLPHLFDRFYKADPSRSGRGSGLGLAIAQENARLLGAGLAVRSEVGVGTEFRLELPVGPPS